MKLSPTSTDIFGDGIRFGMAYEREGRGGERIVAQGGVELGLFQIST